MLRSTSTDLPRLFYSEGSPYARICRMAVRERGLLTRVQEVITTLRDPAAALLPYNPVGRVPALVLRDGTTLTETTLILGWLEKLGSDSAILADDSRSLAAYGRALGLLDGIAVWNRELRRPETERSPSVLSLEETRANRIADSLEREMPDGAYEAVDAAFLALAAVLGYAERRHTVWNWRTGRPRLDQWFSRASQRTAFRETLPPLSGI